jgi:hypothetical protein
MESWWSTLRAYAIGSGKWGAAQLFAFITGIGGLIADVGFHSSLFHMPRWVWEVLLFGIAIGAPIWSFRRLRLSYLQSETKLKKIETQQEIPQLEIIFGKDPWNRQNDAGRILFRVGLQLRPGAPYPVHDVSLTIKSLSPMRSGPTSQSLWTCRRALQARLTSMHYSADKFQVNVAPACEAIDVLKIGVPNSLEPITLFHNVKQGPLNILPQGPYEMTLLASGGRSVPCERRFVFGVTSTGKAVFKPDARFRI